MKPFLGLKQNSRDFFLAPFRSFLQMLAKKRLWAELPMIFGDFNFDILLTVLDVFNFLWSIFFWGGYLIQRVFVY